MAGDSAQSRGYFLIIMRYYFAVKKDGTYNHLSTNGQAVLDFYIGETLAHILCECDNPIELIRLNRHNGDIVIVQVRPLNISLIV